MYGRCMFDFASSEVCSRSTSFFRDITWEDRVPAENRAMNSFSCAIFFSRCAFCASTRLPGSFPSLEPAAKGVLRFARSAARQQALHADVFVQFRPVDSFATGDETPVVPFGRSSVRQTREPRKRHGDRAAVGEIRNEGILSDTHATRQRGPEFSSRNIHAMTSTTRQRFLQPTSQPVRSLHG